MTECFFYTKAGQISSNRKGVKDAFESLKDGRHKLVIEDQNKRSLPQNSYLHGVVIPLVFHALRDAGFDSVKDVHDTKRVLKGLFLKEKVVNEGTGEVITEVVKETHLLSTLEMVKFIDDIVQWASEYLSLTIPLPGEQSKIDY
jgi:hypothetical protein